MNTSGLYIHISWQGQSRSGGVLYNQTLRCRADIAVAVGGAPCHNRRANRKWAVIAGRGRQSGGDVIGHRRCNQCHRGVDACRLDIQISRGRDDRIGLIRNGNGGCGSAGVGVTVGGREGDCRGSERELGQTIVGYRQHIAQQIDGSRTV